MSTKFKKSKIGTGARDELVKGANYLADAVKSTLGPFGQNFLLEKGKRITNDGVSIARELELRDEIQNRGLDTLRESAIRTNDEAGDGTTTAITLAQAILQEAIKYMPKKDGFKGKLTASSLRQKIEKERLEVTQKLIEKAEKVTSKEQLISSAKVSVEDDSLGELIGATQWDIGEYGLLIAEETAERKCYVETVKGIRIDNGLGASILMNNLEKQTLEVNNSRVILTNYIIDGLKTLAPLLDSMLKNNIRDVIIVARAFSETAIRECLENHKNGFRIYPINAPYTDQNEIMKDLVAITGGRYIFNEESELSDIQLSDVGFVEKLVAGRYDSVFTGKDDEYSKKRVSERVELLKKKLQGEKSEFEKKNLQSRIAQLSTGFGIIKIGANSDSERKYLKDKADDAVNAVRAALQEGVVKGAGIAFKEISDTLPDDYILKRPLCSIYEQIMFTAPEGFIVEDWVKDPVKVLRIALEKACTVASVLATGCGATATERDSQCSCNKNNSEQPDEN